MLVRILDRILLDVRLFVLFVWRTLGILDSHSHYKSRADRIFDYYLCLVSNFTGKITIGLTELRHGRSTLAIIMFAIVMNDLRHCREIHKNLRFYVLSFLINYET